MAVSYTIPKIVTLNSTDEYVFDPDPYARYNVKLYLYAETLDNTLTFYDSQGNAQEPIAVTSGLEIIAKNANYRKLTLSDSNNYTVYMVIQKDVYSSDSDLSCIPPSVDLSISPLSINVNISAQTISQLSVNVAAWTAGTLAVNISAQSVGNLAVNLAAITTSASLNIAIASSAVTLQVNIASQTANLNVNLAAQSLANLAVNVAAWNAGQINVDIAAQTVGNLAVNIAAQSVGNLNVNLAAQSANVNVALAASSVTLDINLSSITSGVTLDVSVQNASLTVVVSGTAQVNIASTTGNIPVSIAASSATVTVSVSGTADVNISSTTGNIPVSIAASSATVSVNVGNVPAVNPNFETTLSSALTSGNNYTSLAVAATPVPLLSGQSLTLVSGTNTQVVTVSQTVPAGSTSIPVDSFAANFGYPIGTSLIGSLNATILNTILDVNVTSQSSNINVNLAAQTVGNIAVNLAAWNAGTIDVNLAANNAGNITVNLAAISATTNLNVNLAASSATVTVSVSGTADVNITNASLTISGTVSISGTVTVSVSGTADVNISSTTGNVPVSIAASSATVNVTVGNVPVVNPNFGTTLSSALTNGSNYTSLSVASTPTPLLSGQSITLVSGTNTQTVTVSQTIPAGSTSIPVNQFTANYAYPVGSSIIGSLNATILNTILDVNVSSQSADINVNISSTTGNIPVSIAAISTTSNLNVAIASSAVTLNVNISSQTANVNVALAASSITLTTQGNVPITIGTNTYQSVPVSIVAQQIGNINVNLAAQTVGNINVNIAAQSGNVNVALAASSATVTVSVSGTADVNISSTTGNVPVSIAASSATVTVSVSGTANVNISSTTGNIPVSIAASSVTLDVSVGNVPAVNPNFETATTSALTNGSNYTSLAVNATPVPLLSGQSITLVSGTNTQTVTVSQTIPAGSTSIPVNQFTANYAYPTGTSLIGSLNATILNTILDVNVTSQSSNINVNLAAQSSNINVNLAASGITLTVSVSGTPNVNIASQSSNLNVAIAANNAGNLTVSLAAIATTANLNVNLNASAITLNVNITNASITITGSVSISGVPAVTINAGSAVIGSISEIVSPVTARTVLGFGYQESVAFLNYSGSGFFMSGSAADSSANQLLSNESWTQTVLATSSGGIGYASIATLQKVSSALSVWGMQGAVVTNSSGSHSFQALGAIYSDNAGSMGNLIAQTQLAAFSVGDVAAGTIINFAVFFAAPVSLSANTSYFFAFTILQTNGTSELYLNLISSGTGYYSNSSFVYGFPSASSWTSFTGSTSVVLLSSAGTTVSNPVNVTQTIEATETLNGQLVFKVGASAPNQAFIGISSFTYTIQDSTTGEYLVNARTVNTVNAGQGLVSVTDSVSLSSVTLNSGDSFVVTISSITVFGGAADGSTGYASVYFDSLDGISYLVLPLK